MRVVPERLEFSASLDESGRAIKPCAAGRMEFVVMSVGMRMKRQLRGMAALSGVLLPVLMASCAALSGEPRRGGPLDPFPPHGMFISDRVGQRFTDGFEI